MRFHPTSFILGAVLIAATATTCAQEQEPPVHWYILGGASQPAGRSGDLLSTGWTAGFGALFGQPDSALGLRVDIDYASNDAKNSFIYPASTAANSVLNITGGWADVWSASLDVQIQTTGAVYGYLLGGIGVYNVSARLKGYRDGYVCNPWWSYCYTGSGHEVTAGNSSSRFGSNAGAGMGFRMHSGATLFVEARYIWVETSNQSFQYIPIVVGWRY